MIKSRYFDPSVNHQQAFLNDTEASFQFEKLFKMYALSRFAQSNCCPCRQPYTHDKKQRSFISLNHDAYKLFHSIYLIFRTKTTLGKLQSLGLIWDRGYNEIIKYTQWVSELRMDGKECKMKAEQKKKKKKQKQKKKMQKQLQKVIWPITCSAKKWSSHGWTVDDGLVGTLANRADSDGICCRI